MVDKKIRFFVACCFERGERGLSVPSLVVWSLAFRKKENRQSQVFIEG